MEEDGITCRICLEPSERKDVISPCSCAGSMKWVHRECLDQWRTTHEDRAFSRCTECLKSYKLFSRVNDSPISKRRRYCLYWYFVIKDFLVALLCTQIVVVVAAALVWTLDRKSKWMIKFFIMELHALVFYYLAGLAFSLAFVGLLFMMMHYCGTGPVLHHQNNSCDLMCYGCMDAGTVNTTGGNSCCHCGNCVGGCGECCATGGAGGGSCCSCGECASCSGAGEAIIPLVIFMVVLLAMLGAVVSVFAGVMYIQQITREHLGILRKRSLAGDYLVEDLAADDCEGAVCVSASAPPYHHCNNNTNNNSYNRSDIEAGFEDTSINMSNEHTKRGAAESVSVTSSLLGHQSSSNSSSSASSSAIGAIFSSVSGTTRRSCSNVSGSGSVSGSDVELSSASASATSRHHTYISPLLVTGTAAATFPSDHMSRDEYMIIEQANLSPAQQRELLNLGLL